MRILIFLCILASSPQAGGVSLRLLAVPPGPVTEATRVELRASVTGPEDQEATVEFFWDHQDSDHSIQRIPVHISPGRKFFCQAWWQAQGHAGEHLLICVTRAGNETAEERWPIEVLPSESWALPQLQGMWIEPYALWEMYRSMPSQDRGKCLAGELRSMKDLGVHTLIIAYVEMGGSFFYPSEIEFTDRDVGRVSSGKDCPMDVVGMVLSQADIEGMRVVLGLGRAGDTQLLWEFGKEDWSRRNQRALDVGKRIADELHQRYGHHPSFYGWYLTHEMNDLGKASAYYDPLAEHCHSLAVEMPVMVAPAGTPVWDREDIRRSKVDVFACQDAVGAGYIPYENTYRPERRIAMLKEIFAGYQGLFEGSGKHLWADLEIWEMDGSQGYSGAYPARFDRVKQQIDVECQHTEMLTGYAWHGYMEDPHSREPKGDFRAEQLFTEAFRNVKRRP